MIKLLRSLRLPTFEYIYVMYSPFSLPWRAKVGISDNAKRRRAEVEASVKSKLNQPLTLYCHVYLPVLFARAYERAVHRVVLKLQYRGLFGTNGGTEWAYCINVVSFFALWFTLWYYGHNEAMYKAVWMLCLPVPIDFFIFIIALALIQYAALIAIIWGGFWALNLY